MGTARQEAAVHGLRTGDTFRMESREHTRLVAPRCRRAQRCSRVFGRPQSAVCERTVAAPRRQRPGRTAVGGRRRRRPERVRMATQGPDRRRASSARGDERNADATSQLPARRAPTRPMDGVAEHRRGSFGGSGVGNYGGVDTVPVDSHGFHQSVVLTLPPLGAVFLAPEA